jgi:hypothetical protein
MPRSAHGARRYWRDSCAPITAWLEGASDDALDQLRPSHDSGPRTAREVVLTLVDEQVHHGAEIALMRDLYRVLVSTAAESATRPYGLESGRLGAGSAGPGG